MTLIKTSVCTRFFVPAFLSLFSLTINAYAAEVPAGTKLAKKQIFNVGIGAEAPTLDPQKGQDNVSARIGYDLYEGLATENEKGDIVPGIASKWDISKDGLTYTFYIRPNAKFSDGSPITAEDAVFSIRRLVDPKLASPYAELISMVSHQAKQNPKNLV